MDVVYLAKIKFGIFFEGRVRNFDLYYGVRIGMCCFRKMLCFRFLGLRGYFCSWVVG